MPDSPLYRVLPSPKAKRQLLELAAAAADPDAWAAFRDRWRALVDALQRDPSAFGEPRYHTKHANGVVHHRLIDGISMQFAVYEQERVVFVLDIKTIMATP